MYYDVSTLFTSTRWMSLLRLFVTGVAGIMVSLKIVLAVQLSVIGSHLYTQHQIQTFLRYGLWMADNYNWRTKFISEDYISVLRDSRPVSSRAQSPGLGLMPKYGRDRARDRYFFRQKKRHLNHILGFLKGWQIVKLTCYSFISKPCRIYSKLTFLQALKYASCIIIYVKRPFEFLNRV